MKLDIPIVVTIVGTIAFLSHGSIAVENPEHCTMTDVSEEMVQGIEADSYWCLTKLLDDIQVIYVYIYLYIYILHVFV